jgi:hypothetical protein
MPSRERNSSLRDQDFPSRAPLDEALALGVAEEALERSL